MKSIAFIDIKYTSNITIPSLKYINKINCSNIPFFFLELLSDTFKLTQESPGSNNIETSMLKTRKVDLANNLLEDISVDESHSAENTSNNEEKKEQNDIKIEQEEISNTRDANCTLSKFDEKNKFNNTIQSDIAPDSKSSKNKENHKVSISSSYSEYDSSEEDSYEPENDYVDKPLVIGLIGAEILSLIDYDF